MTTYKMSGRIVLIQTAFNPNAESYNEVIYFAKGALEQFPEGLQGIPYPYPQITIFNGDSGMEFPMIVNDAAFPNRSTDVYVTIHEITHMFFPFFTAMSETKYGWFDEGMAYFLPQKIQMSFDPSDHRVRAAKGYAAYAGRETDLPLMTPTFFVREPDLSMLNYYKSAVAFDMLRNVLGDEIFRKCLYEFINRWNGKHPTPYDFFYTLNNVSGQNLNWFWQKWFFEKGQPDNAIKEVRSGEGKIKVLVEQVGNYPIPFEFSVTAPDGRKEIFSETAAIWSDGKKEKMDRAGC
jgi:aminopeptidase N